MLYFVLMLIGSLIGIGVTLMSQEQILLLIIFLLICVIGVAAKRLKIIYTSLLFGATFVILYQTGKLNFNFLPQVESLLMMNPVKVLLSGHEWGPRYMVSYPSVLISKLFEIDIDLAFTIYCSIFLFGIVLLFGKIGEVIKPKRKMVFVAISILAVAALTFIMNGRLISAYFGLTLILYLQMKAFKEERFFQLREIVLLFLGFFLSTVSSGTMMVTLTQIILGGSMLLKYYKGFRDFLILITAISLFISLMGSHVLQMVNKNLFYFGGGFSGFINMFHHGLGRIILINKGVILLILVSVPFAVYLFLFFYKKMKKTSDGGQPFIVAIPISILCGLFGLSTATMIIPALIFFTSLVTAKFSFE